MIALLIAAIQVSAMLLVALGLVWLLRKRTAALRHLVLAIAMGCSAFVPIVGALLPAPASRAIVLPSAFEVPAAMVSQGASASALDALPGNAPTLAPQEQSTGVVAVAPGQTHGWQAGLPRILDAAWAIYLAGLLVSLATLLVGLLQLRWFAARSVPVRGDGWQRQAAAIANAYGLRRPIRLALNPHRALLATWGAWRPRVLLPGDANEWPEDRIRAVLLHELAHVRRNDWIIQVLASVLRSVYWFNPLVWLACTRLQQESENACDDAAISHGADRTGYASHLLELARAMARPGLLLAPAPSMAHRSTLRRRVADILDPATLRTPTTGRSVVAVATTMLLVTFIVGGCQIEYTSTREYVASREQVSAPGSSTVEAAEPEPKPVQVTTRRMAISALPPPTRAPAPPPPPPEPHGDDPAPTAKTLAAGIADYAGAMLDGGMSVHVTGYAYLMGKMGAVQRTAQRVVDDEGRDASGVSTKGTALLSALADTAHAAAGIVSRPGTSARARQELAEIEADLRRKQAEFGAMILPLPAVTSILVSTPERRAAVRALDLAQTARAEAAFVQPGPRVSLLAALETLELAAQSVLMGDDSDRGAAAGKLAALSTAVLLTDRVATNIGGRDIERKETRDKARELAQSLRALAPQLGVVPPSEAEQSQNEVRWLGWMTPGLRQREDGHGTR